MNADQRKLNKIASSDYIIIPFLILIGFMIYSNALHNSFVYDDYFDLNEALKFRSPGSIPQLFYSNMGKLYRPFKFFLYALDLWIWNLSAFGCHLTNIFLHLGCGILVYVLLLELTGKKILGFWAALFFLVHPVQTESVTWVASRGSPASALFLLAAFLLFLRSERRRRFPLRIFSLGAFYLALLSKETAFVFPFLLGFYLALITKEPVKNIIKKLIPYLAVLMFYIISRTMILRGIAQNEPVPLHYAIALSHVPTFLWKYLALLLFPVRLCADYQFLNPDWGLPFILSSLAWILTFLFLFPIVRKDPLLSFFAAWYFISLAPVLNFIPINAFLADRFLYLPSIGFIGFIAVLLNKSLKGRSRIFPGVFLAAIALLFCIRTIIRNRDWKNDLSLWSHESRIYPDNFNLHHLYAEALARAHKFQEAKREYEQALQLNPGYDMSHIGFGQTLVELGDLDKARAEFKTALENTEKKEFVLFNLGNLEEKAGNISEAESYYLKAVSINPTLPYTPALQNLGHLYLQKGDFARAYSYLVRTVSQNPQNAYAHNNIALLYLKENISFSNPAKALEHATRAVLLSGEQNSSFLYTQALAFLKCGNKANARASLQKALALQPDFPPFLELLKKCE